MPYVITTGTAISTDPTITTNGQTDFGTIYRDSSQDGSFAIWAFGSESTFDVYAGISYDPNSFSNVAVFKFQSLELDGPPSISTTGGVTRLGLIGVDGITSGGAGGSFSFSGLDFVFLATQDGAINLGPNISFDNINHLLIYARGTNGDLTMGAVVTGVPTLNLDAEGSVQVNADETMIGNFNVSAGTNYLTGTGNINAGNIFIQSLGDINFDLNRFSGGSGSVGLNAANTLNMVVVDNTVFPWDTLNAQGTTINISGANSPTTFDFSSSSGVYFQAGSGGISASTIAFYGNNLSLLSDGDIDIYSARISGGPFAISSIISSNGNISAASDVDTGELDALANITVGGAVNIEVENNTSGGISAGGDISVTGGIFTPGDGWSVVAQGSVSAPAIITGALMAGTDITIDNTNGSFLFGILANSITAGGTLSLINSPGISPNNGSYSNNDGATFNDLTITVGAITSTGPIFPVVSSNGGDANPDFSDSNPGNGGNITLTTTAGGLTIGAGANLDSILANGGAYRAGGPFGGGNGGTINVLSVGDVVVNDGSNGPGIFASTGMVSDDTTEFGGIGGTVNITTSSFITVNGSIEVSSEDSAHRPNSSMGRESANGGTIDLQSNLTTGTGITIGTNGALLSYLSLNALNANGTPGSITLSTLGADVVVNGLVRADFGTITIDQDDPAGMTPSITLDGSTVQGATLNIEGSGDLTIGPNNSTAINIFGGTWNVTNDITINAATTTFAYSLGLSATAGNAINFTGGTSNAPATLTLPLSADSTFAAGSGGINAQFVDINYSGAGLNLTSDGDITANSIKFTDSYVRGNVNAAGNLTTTGDLFEGNIFAGADINVGGGVIASSLEAGLTINVGQYISVSSVSAGGDITAGSTRVQYITAPTGVLSVSGGIYPDIFSTAPQFPEQGAAAPHTYTVDSIVSPNGIDFSGNQFNGILNYTSGGLLTINANSLSFDASTGIGSTNFNGADVNGFSTGNTPTVPGDGGTLTVNATNDITVNTPITASSGLTDANGTIGGAGGTVSLISTDGAVSVNSTIQVSSNDPMVTQSPSPTPQPPRRRSAVGGNITLQSGKSAAAGSRAVAINITNSSQLLSLLAAAPTPRPGGKITILATGANSDVNVNGRVQADGGTIDIRNQGSDGHVTISGTNGSGFSQTHGGITAVPNMLSADVIKAGAFGANGQLIIGNTNINADTLLRLYATDSNGQLNFVANTTLSSRTIDLAAGTITIQPSVVVTIQGSGGPANIYTNNPNYSGFGGTSPNNGTFGGNGAQSPRPLSSAPAFDDPAPRPAGAPGH